MLMPSGLLADHGCARLGASCSSDAGVDAMMGFDNRDGALPNPSRRALRRS